MNVFCWSDHCNQWFFNGFWSCYHRFQWFSMVPDHWSNNAMVSMDRRGLIFLHRSKSAFLCFRFSSQPSSTQKEEIFLVMKATTRVGPNVASGNVLFCVVSCNTTSQNSPPKQQRLAVCNRCNAAWCECMTTAMQSWMNSSKGKGRIFGINIGQGSDKLWLCHRNQCR